MQHVSLTPFGRQPVTPALLAARRQGCGAPVLPRVDKWALLDDLRRARAVLGVTDRDLAVLHALLSFLPGKALEDDRPLVVFPSNAALSDRAHGMAESTLRRHLAALVSAGLIWRRDSPNGKRYARRDCAGALAQAFGFDLRPLLCRAPEIAAAAAETEAAARRLRLLRETVVLHLRDATKLVAHGRAAGLAGDWAALDERLAAIRSRLRRRLDPATMERLAAGTAAALAEVGALLAAETAETGASAAHSGRHHPESEDESCESEACHENAAQAAGAGASEWAPPQPGREGAAPALTLHLVLEACPDLLPYARGRLRNWRDLVATAAEVRPMMGISASAWAEAERCMGPETAAVAVSAILQRIGRIRNPGGYLRALSARAQGGGFSPVPMIMALLNRDGRAGRLC
jgi:replication initiation protein RepC